MCKDRKKRRKIDRKKKIDRIINEEIEARRKSLLLMI
jgi:hypothetical protein